MLPLQPMSPFHVPPWKALFGWKAFLDGCVWLVTDLVTSPKSSPKASPRAMLAVDAKGLLPSYRPFVPSNSGFLLATVLFLATSFSVDTAMNTGLG